MPKAKSGAPTPTPPPTTEGPAASRRHRHRPAQPQMPNELYRCGEAEADICLWLLARTNPPSLSESTYCSLSFPRIWDRVEKKRHLAVQYLRAERAQKRPPLTVPLSLSLSLSARRTLSSSPTDVVINRVEITAFVRSIPSSPLSCESCLTCATLSRTFLSRRRLNAMILRFNSLEKKDGDNEK